MTKYLLDPNVVWRFCNPSDVQHHLAVDAISCLLNQADECFITAQVLIESANVVATRPVQVNGLGWTTETTRKPVNPINSEPPLGCLNQPN